MLRLPHSVAENSGQLECHSSSSGRYRRFERHEFLLIISNYQSIYQSTVPTVFSTTEECQKATIFNNVVPSQKTSILKTPYYPRRLQSSTPSYKPRKRRSSKAHM